MATLFLSYSRDDVGRIRLLAKALERDGHDVWWDRQITGGEEFAGAIERALASADVVIVCWSDSSTKSAWVRDEAAAGRDTGRMVPVTLDGCLPPLGFRQFQTIDLADWTGRRGSSALKPLKAAIAEKTSGDGLHPAVSPAVRRPRRRRTMAWPWAVAAALIVAVAGLASYSRGW